MQSCWLSQISYNISRIVPGLRSDLTCLHTTDPSLVSKEAMTAASVATNTLSLPRNANCACLIEPIFSLCQSSSPACSSNNPQTSGSSNRAAPSTSLRISLQHVTLALQRAFHRQLPRRDYAIATPIDSINRPSSIDDQVLRSLKLAFANKWACRQFVTNKKLIMTKYLVHGGGDGHSCVVFRILRSMDTCTIFL